ncbi:MAG: hypothetical protein Q9183_002958, partial [Haloplaca sp. 2 TL-2023]
MADTVLAWHNTCYNFFIKLHQSLTKHRQFEDDFSQETFVDFFGRFNVWADNIGAGRRGRASLDYRLRDASDIKDYVVLALQRLSKVLQS